MKETKEFMMIFRYTPKADYQPTKEELEQQQQWGGFIGQLAISEKLVSTHRLGDDGTLISSDLTTTPGMYSADGMIVGGNMIVRAQNLDDASEMAKACPILNIGGSVEIRSITPMEP